MNKETTVYWGVPFANGPVPYFLNIEEPSPSISELKKLGKELGALTTSPSMSILRCPSIVDTTRNTFVITSPIDINITWMNGKVIVNSDDSSFVDIRDHASGFLSVTFMKYIFFTEDDELNMRVRNAFFTKNDFTTKCNIIEGEFNIGQWFRNLDASFYFKESGTVVIKKGDPLFYVEFQTKQTVKLKKFMFNNELAQINQFCLSAKNYNKFPLANYFTLLYSMFRKSKVKGQILKNIKNNLIE